MTERYTIDYTALNRFVAVCAKRHGYTPMLSIADRRGNVMTENEQTLQYIEARWKAWESSIGTDKPEPPNAQWTEIGFLLKRVEELEQLLASLAGSSTAAVLIDRGAPLETFSAALAATSE